MPQDLLQISLEHHRAGRLTQAEAGYRQVLAAEPDNADAMHWLGVLLCQASQFPESIKLLERSIAIRPDDAAYQHNLGQAYQGAGKKEQSITAFERAAAIDPSATDALLALAQARLARGRPGDARAAVDALKKAQVAGLDSGELYRHLGVALLASGRADDAIAACRTALSKKPDDAWAMFHLALAYRKKGEVKETRKFLIKALEIEPAMAQAWCALGMLDAEAKRFTEAAGLFRRAIAADRDYTAAYLGLGKSLEAAGKVDDARVAFRQAQKSARGAIDIDESSASTPSSVAALEQHLTPTPEQAQAHFAMAALMNVFPPMTSPSESIASLFDRYAPKFDAHLVNVLDYHVPESLVQAITSVWDGKPMDVLDLGCGTGLCGPLLRPMSKFLAGVDLSSAMIDKARERNIYDKLEVGEMVETLRKSPRGYDLLITADVLIYVGELLPTFEAATAALRPGGLFAFSVEAAGGNRFELIQRSRRYAHSEPYIKRMASIFGLEELHFSTITARKERDQPVMAYQVVLRLPGA